jgi:hypothetical protein
LAPRRIAPSHKTRKVVALLFGAAELVQRRGWIREQYWPDAFDDQPYVLGDPCCTVGAIAAVAGANVYEDVQRMLRDDASTVATAVAAVAIELFGPQCALLDSHGLNVAVGAWNDTDVRTGTEVAAVLCSAAERLDYDDE